MFVFDVEILMASTQELLKIIVITITYRKFSSFCPTADQVKACLKFMNKFLNKLFLNT